MSRAGAGAGFPMNLAKMNGLNLQNFVNNFREFRCTFDKCFVHFFEIIVKSNFFFHFASGRLSGEAPRVNVSHIFMLLYR